MSGAPGGASLAPGARFPYAGGHPVNTMAVGIRLENVVKTFGATRAVDDISLAIEPGELFFMLGPSGCGKTTLLRCIAGFYLPERGRILIGDEDVTHRPPNQRDTGMVFQSYALWPHLTIRENVAFGLEIRRRPKAEIRARVDEALRMVRMADRADHRPAQLSGGQQQRVALARAMVIHPKCLLLDEPLSNLDAKLRLEMRTEIRRICKESGLTAVYVTHDQKEALSIADRLIVLDRGHVEQCGRPQEVYQRPANRFVAHFIGETNFLSGTVLERSNGSARVRTPFGELRSTVIGDAAAGAAVTLSIRPECLRLDPAAVEAPNVLPAVATDTSYLGEVVQQTLRLEAPGAEPAWLKVFELRPTVVARDGAVVPVRVHAAPEDVVALTR